MSLLVCGVVDSSRAMAGSSAASSVMQGPTARPASAPGSAASPAAAPDDPVFSPVVQLIQEFIMGDTSFTEEIKHLRAVIRDKDEILAINLKYNTRFLKQQRLMYDIIKLEAEVEKVQFWENNVFVLQATLNSLRNT
jgi:hypothetical protein